MVTKVGPVDILVVMLAGWVNRHQQDVIACLKEENEILREKLGTKRILLNDSQRMRLAELGKRLGRKVLADDCCAFSRGGRSRLPGTAWRTLELLPEGRLVNGRID